MSRLRSAMALGSVLGALLGRLSFSVGGIVVPSLPPLMALTASPTAATTTLAPAAKRKGRVLCWIPSKGEKGEAVDAVFNTWAKHCDELVFTSSVANAARNVVALDLPPLGAARSLWNIVAVGWRYVYSRMDEFDWFVKCDDDTYFNCDNFKSVVRDLNPSDPHYLGHTSYHLPLPFNLGAGHAISRGTLAALGPRLAPADPKDDIPGFHCPRKISWAEGAFVFVQNRGAKARKLTHARPGARNQITSLPSA